jgi:hypothetical protein
MTIQLIMLVYPVCQTREILALLKDSGVDMGPDLQKEPGGYRARQFFWEFLLYGPGFGRKAWRCAEVMGGMIFLPFNFSYMIRSLEPSLPNREQTGGGYLSTGPYPAIVPGIAGEVWFRDGR